MRLLIDEKHATANSRIGANRIIGFMLRQMESWRAVCGGYQEAMILMAVVAITSERLTRTKLEPALRDMASPLPQHLLARCSVTSIASATGIQRETARRLVNKLVGRGILVRSAAGGINFAAGRLQLPAARELYNNQLEAFCVTSNALIRDGVLRIARTSASQV